MCFDTSKSECEYIRDLNLREAIACSITQGLEEALLVLQQVGVSGQSKKAATLGQYCIANTFWAGKL